LQAHVAGAAADVDGWRIGLQQIDPGAAAATA